MDSSQQRIQLILDLCFILVIRQFDRQRIPKDIPALGDSFFAFIGQSGKESIGRILRIYLGKHFQGKILLQHILDTMPFPIQSLGYFIDFFIGKINMFQV